MRILLVEDDIVIAESVRALLKRNGYVVDLADTVSGAEERLFVESYDCLIFDRGLPDGDGIELVTHVRNKPSDTPILLLTAKHRSDEVVMGLDNGADDYLAKPFLPDVLLARVRALLRRIERPGGSPLLMHTDITVDTNTGRVTKKGERVVLSPKEFQLLSYLLLHKGTAIDRQTLLDHIWGEDTDMFSNTIDVHIRYLRKKLDDKDSNRSIIETVKGKGYMVCDE